MNQLIHIGRWETSRKTTSINLTIRD